MESTSHADARNNTTSAITAATAHAHTSADLGDSPIKKGLDVLPSWRGEGVVRTTPSSFRKKVLLCVRTCEQGKLGDPEEMRGTGGGVRPYTASHLSGRQH
jgi:hypothetical protein